ncbi:MAG: Ig-like domain-containing protein [Gemmatimonadetes bacterium]|nr:Ig-like domain-containing protein [Gemmatimonadota bacterium]
MRTIRILPLLYALVAVTPMTAAARQAGTPARITAQPATLALTRGASTSVSIRVEDVAGRIVGAPLRVGGALRALTVREEADGRWTVTGLVVGEHELVATLAAGGDPLEQRIPVRVSWPAVTRVEVAPAIDAKLYAGTRLRHVARAFHADGSERPYAEFAWRSSDAAVAAVDRFGNVRAVKAGVVTISAELGGVTGSAAHQVTPLPPVTIELDGGTDPVRTGDVQTFTAVVKDARGAVLRDVPVTWSHQYSPDDSIQAPAAPAQLEDGRFVADVPGVYTVVAAAGAQRAESSFRVQRREVVRKVEVMGHGREARVFTTDFWVFEGRDGRDYAFTGSKFGDGISFVWDVTDPGRIVKTDSIQADARTTNDVKVSPDARYAAISREGASNRRNGVVILDLADPAHPVVASVFDDGLTGGVHNMFATNDYLFALSNGDKYVIIDVRDLRNPRYVSEYDHPDSRVHDVWVHDGIAYSAEWGTGVVVVDVGSGRWGGTIERPKFVTSFPLPTGSTHAVFPYHQQSTGKFYLFVGDERVQREGLAWAGTGPDHRVPYDPATGLGGYPRATSGYIQVVDFTDPEAARMVARYEVAEFGTHNLWVEDDVLYQAYYEGGVRMVDVSGELMGNLYTQGREIAVFKAHDPIGYIPNAPGAWSVMPYKGRIFFSDVSSGLWSIRLLPRAQPVS